jgi:hypothetical protein
MKVNIEVEEKDVSQLLNVKNSMLFDMYGNRMLIVKSIEYEIVEREKIEKRFLFSKKIIKVKQWIITEIEIKSYSYDGLFWGSYTDETVINRIISTRDFYKMRDDFTKFIKMPLEAIGVVFPKKDTESK